MRYQTSSKTFSQRQLRVGELVKQNLGELMIDRDCFGEDPIQAVTLKNTIPFLDIGIPSSYNESQTYIPKLLSEMNCNDKL